MLQVDGVGVPVIVLTGQGSESIAVEAMKNGAQDYLLKSTMTAASLLARGGERDREGDAAARDAAAARDELSEANAELQREVAQRKRAEQALQQTYEELEQLVAARTEELSRANRELSTRDRGAPADRGGARAAARARAAGQPPEGRVPRHRLARAADAAQRRARLGARAAVGRRSTPALQARALESIERNARRRRGSSKTSSRCRASSRASCG